MSSLHLRTTLDRKDSNFLRLYEMAVRCSSRSLITPFTDALSDKDESMLKDTHTKRDTVFADFALVISHFKESIVTDRCTSKEDVTKKAKEFSTIMERKVRSIADRFNISTGELEEAVVEVSAMFEKYLTDNYEGTGFGEYQDLMHRECKDGWKQAPKS